MAKKKQGVAKLHGKVKPYTKSAVGVPAVSPRVAVIELPLGDVGNREYLSRHVESRLKTQEQQLAMKRLLRGLQRTGATTKDGKPVQRPGEAVRWLLEKIGENEQ